MFPGYASLLCYPLTKKKPEKNTPVPCVKIKGSIKEVILKSVSFGLQSGYVDENEVKLIILAEKMRKGKGK